MSSTTFGAVVMVLALAGLVVVSKNWRAKERIDRVDIRGTHLLSVDEVSAQAQVAPRMHMEAVDLTVIRSRLLTNPLVRHASVTREHSTLVITITERTPTARVMVDGAVRLVDAEGMLFPVRDVQAELDLPVIYGVSGNAGKGLDSAALAGALSILHAAEGRSHICGLISTVRRTSDGTYWLETNGDAVPVRVGTATDVANKLSLLQAFVPQLLKHSAAGQRAEYVDVRFRDQVVVRWASAIAAAH